MIPADRLGGVTFAGHVLHLFLMLDVSGSMKPDGRIQALNNAIEDLLPHLRDFDDETPEVDVRVRVLTFASTVRWHIAEATPVHDVVWHPLEVEEGGTTEMGAAIDAVRRRLAELPRSGIPPAIVLVSDGQATDLTAPTFGQALEDLRADTWGARSRRIAVGIGADADFDALARFIGNVELPPLSAANPEQLIRRLPWAVTSVVKESSRAVDAGYNRPRYTPRPDEDMVPEWGMIDRSDQRVPADGVSDEPTSAPSTAPAPSTPGTAPAPSTPADASPAGGNSGFEVWEDE